MWAAMAAADFEAVLSARRLFQSRPWRFVCEISLLVSEAGTLAHSGSNEYTYVPHGTGIVHVMISREQHRLVTESPNESSWRQGMCLHTHVVSCLNLQADARRMELARDTKYMKSKENTKNATAALYQALKVSTHPFRSLGLFEDFSGSQGISRDLWGPPGSSLDLSGSEEHNGSQRILKDV